MLDIRIINSMYYNIFLIWYNTRYEKQVNAYLELGVPNTWSFPIPNGPVGIYSSDLKRAEFFDPTRVSERLDQVYYLWNLKYSKKIKFI